MRVHRSSKGLSLVEIMISVSILALVTYGITVCLSGIERTLTFESKMDYVEGGATRLVDRLGRDLRESSYAYVFAGDWSATRGATVSIDIARNYFSSNPLLGGSTLVPGISNEGWRQCPNPSCTWCNNQSFAGMVPIRPHAFLAQPVRNNPQSTAPTNPPSSLQVSTGDAMGRLFGHLGSGDTCPLCGSWLQLEAYFTGILMFSPRRADRSFSYIPGSNEAQWESMVFYCPFRTNRENFGMRRYVFYASSINPAACLTDLLDFDGNGVIESPPMTNIDGDFVLDADAEYFFLKPSGSTNRMLYTRWDSVAGRSFQIDLDRATGIADVLVVGGTYGTGVTQQIQLEMSTYARGLCDFEASSFINNPSWEAGGTIINPLGVIELGVIRVTFQVDRSRTTDPTQIEAVQSLMFRPRN